MEIKKFLEDILHYGSEWSVKLIDKDEQNLEIHIYIEYVREDVILKGENGQEKLMRIYDFAPERKWQHLSLFEYITYIHCRVPRYLENREGEKSGIKTLGVPWAEPYVSYTKLFAIFVLQVLHAIKEQKTTAQICKTSEIIVRTIMDNAVEKALEVRGYATDLKHVSIDEKSFGQGHQYASILIDAEQGKVLECVEGHAAEQANMLYYSVTGQEVSPTITVASMDMWKGFIKATQESAPNARICFDKFHVFKHLTDAINETRKMEIKNHPQKDLLKGAKFTLLKNKENRTEKQQKQFEQIDYENWYMNN